MDNFFSGQTENLAEAKKLLGNKLKIHRKDATNSKALEQVFKREGEIDVTYVGGIGEDKGLPYLFESANGLLEKYDGHAC